MEMTFPPHSAEVKEFLKYEVIISNFENSGNGFYIGMQGFGVFATGAPTVESNPEASNHF